ncbi:MAG: iron-containing alcohol dehydrogenase [Gemmobacter sp.]
MSFERVAPDSQLSPQGTWTALIDDIVGGTWFNPELGRTMAVDFDAIVIRETLDGGEADLVAPLGLGTSIAVVSDAATHDALGGRVARNLRTLGPVEAVVLDRPHADLASAEDLRARLRPYDAVVAVGSGTVNDLCKYATHLDGRGYCVFATAPSMNGYTSSTASMSLASGLKVSLPAQVPKGFFVDLGVSAAAPPHLAASGFADCLARSVAQVDWWMSHRVTGTAYWSSPYLIQDADERILNRKAHLLPGGDVGAVGALYRVLTLCGLGIAFVGVSNPGSMGEHQISHYIDCFARDRHPGTLHGQQVGVASLTMARLQQALLASDTAPQVSATRIDADDMVRRMGPEIAAECGAEWRKKAFSQAGAEAFNERLAALWPALRREVAAFTIPVAEMDAMLAACGGPRSAADLGLPVDFYREAVRHSLEMRNRFSFLDIAADAGMLDDFAAGEA